MVSYYKAEKLSDHITAIRSLTDEILYLIEGKEQALLVDTCLGVGHLRKFVEGLTDLPVTVVLTHGHVDHALGAPEFDDVWMNPLDTEIYKRMSPLEERIGYIRGNLGGAAPELTEADFVQPEEPHFHDLEDGRIFDLGDIEAEVIALPGHTPGTMVVLVPEKRTLILGDACNNATFLFDNDSLSVEEYMENLISVKERLVGRYDTVCLCHHVMTAPEDMMESVIGVCRDILDGSTDDQPFEFMGSHCFVAKAADEQFRRKDGGAGNIIYRKEKIRKH